MQDAMMLSFDGYGKLQFDQVLTADDFKELLVQKPKERQHTYSWILLLSYCVSHMVNNTLEKKPYLSGVLIYLEYAVTFSVTWNQHLYSFCISVV